MYNDKHVKNAILVWKFSDAPEMFRNLSEHGGDEDWLAFVPSSLAQDWIGWMETGSSFGCCEVSRHPVPGGEVRIGAHS